MRDVAKHSALERARERLEEVSERVGTDLLACERCGHEMVIRSTQVSENPCRNDIRIKCPLPTPENEHDGCGWWSQHGIRIPREEYEFEMSQRDHRLVDAVNTETPETTFEERMAALGYLDR